VANHPSAEKRNRQRITRTARNRAIQSSVRTYVKRVRAAVAGKDKDAANKALKIAISALGKASVKGAVHRKAASRTIARLSAQVAKLGGAAAAKPAAPKAEKPAKAVKAPKS
jgi:small subunit ribosomal protein S20